MKIRRLLHWDIWFYPLVLLTAFSIAILPLVIRVRGTPQDYFYTMSQGFYLDYDYYLAIMREGRYQFLTLPPFSTEPTSPSLLHIFYLYLGKAAMLVGLPNPVMYYLAIFMSLGLFIVISYRLATFLFPRPWNRVCLVFLLFAGSLPPIAFGSKGLEIFPAYPWWVPIGSAYHRLTRVPHHFVAQVISIAVIYLWLKNKEKKTVRTMFILIILQIAGIIIFPIPGLVVILAIAMEAGWEMVLSFRRRGKKSALMNLAPVLFLGMATLVTFALLYRQVQGQSSWGAEFVGKNQILRPHLPIAQVIWDYAMVLGVLGFLIQFATPGFKNRPETRFFFFLLASPYLLMAASEMVGGHGTRLVGSSPFVAAAFLATFGCMRIMVWLKGQKPRTALIRFFPVLITFLVLAGSLPGWWYFYQVETKLEWTTNVYLPKAWVVVLSYLDKTGRQGDIVLSREQVGPLIPMFTDLRPYLAHPDLTYDFLAKQKQTEVFYAGSMKTSEAKEFLRRNKIRYVYWGWYENDVGKTPYSGILKLIFKGDHVDLYEVL